MNGIITHHNARAEIDAEPAGKIGSARATKTPKTNEGESGVSRRSKGGPRTATVMTPSFPTFSIALAMSSPIARSPLAEIVPT